ncbi:MAG: replicative DNA helicase [Crocinitomicaceae bacterium]|nr:replicative DNA helicase [Crocinitomicaceae bacterium]
MENPGQNLQNNNQNSRNQRINPFADVGKLPPQAIDLEEAVLGALMLENQAVNDSIDILKKPEFFYKEAHQKIFSAILKLFGNSEPIDILTVTNQLKSEGQLEKVGGAFYISQLTNKVASSAHVEYHARIIAQKYIQRELIRISSETIRSAYDETQDVFDLLNQAESDLFSVAEGNINKSYDTMGPLVTQAIANIEAAKAKGDGISGVQTGFTDLDRVTSGWQPSDMIVLAARPGMGKTAFVLSMARNTAVDYNKGVAIFSLEMASVQLVNRLIASETGISSEKLRKGTLEDYEFKQLHARINRLADAPIFIDDTPGISIFELRAKCRRLKMQHDIQLVIIDYLQLMTAGTGKGGNREQEISTISRSIKEIAKEINVPIIALSQLSRSVETRGGDKRPMLSDLRESGAIEQDADIVTFIYRPEYYGMTEDENGNPTQGVGEIIIAKHRNGALENVRLKFIANLAKFDNLDTFDTPNFGGGFGPNNSFDEAGNMTIGSKMNEPDNDDFSDLGSNDLDDPPF